MAFTLRHVGWNWDEGQHLHPDERHLSMVTQALEAPKSRAEWFDTDRSGFNPYRQGINSYVYGLLPIRIVHALTVERGTTDLQEIARVGRLCSALWSTGTVALVFLLGYRLQSTRFAVVSSLLMAFCVLSIQQAHFYTVDSAGVFFATACTGLGLLALREDNPWLILPSAAIVGVAMACRLNLGLLTFWVIGVSLASLWQSKTLKPVVALIAGGILSLLLFRLFQPNAFAASGFIPEGLNPRWLNDIAQVRRISDGSMEVPFTLQWVGRIPWLYAIQQLILWGMGLPLGLLSVGGTVWLLWSKRSQPGHWLFLLALWPLILIGYHGGIFLHTLRYFLPAYPLLIMGGLLALRHVEYRNLRRLLTGIVLLGTAVYALAFVQMYRDPHPRIEASKWLYRNLAAGGSVVSEHWDDALPLRLPGEEAGHRRISFAQLDVYHRESPQKIRTILEEIRQADYLVLSSTRASYTIPRMPLRYPVMTRFYERLTKGESASGLREVARFYRRPHLLGWHLNTLQAEEALRVYDHPLVRIYEKTPDFNVDSLEKELTESVDFNEIPQIPYRKANRGNQGWLNPDEFEKRRQGEKWSDRFSDNSFGNQAPLLIWGLILWFLAPLSFPLSYILFSQVRDRGWAVSRLLGLLTLSTLAWWPAAIGWLPFGTSLLIASMLLGGGSALFWTLRANEMLRWFKKNWAVIVWNEAILWGVFAFFLVLRILNPDLWHPWAGGEKPMDFAYLNATVQTPFFPPPNPWLSGASINYYYYGFVLFATLIRLTGISPDLAYNLAIPSCALFITGGALSLSMVFFPWFRTRRGWKGWWGCSLLTVVLVLFTGNLGQLREFLKPGPLPYLRDIYWNASRVLQVPPGIAQPITEFPLFSLLYGDLHAHLIALPVSMLCLGASWQLFRRFHPARVLACGWLLGSLWVMNTWDFPIQASIFIFCTFAGAFPLKTPAPDLWGRLGWSLLGLLTARLSFAPYHWYAQAFPVKLIRWEGPHSTMTDLFLAHGLFLTPLILGGLLLWKQKPLRYAPWTSRLLPGLLVLGCLFTIGFLEHYTLEGDIGRMNMVFKFYYQIWWILAVLTSVLVCALIRKPGTSFWSWMFPAVCLILLGLSMLYTVTAIPAKLQDRYWQTEYRGLDGLAYMNDARWVVDGKDMAFAADRAAINWLRANAKPFEVIMEAQRPEYQWGGRMAWHSGLSAVLGWNWHMRQQRSGTGGDRAVWKRAEDIRKFYATADPDIARKYGVRYIIAGELERITYGNEAILRLEQSPELERVFSKDGLSIYQYSPNNN